MKRAHFSKLVNGRIKGLPPLPQVRIGRRLLFREEAIEQWIRDVDNSGKCSGAR